MTSKALNYIPAELIASCNGPDVIWLEGELWILKDKYLKSAHYERKENDEGRTDTTCNRNWM